VEVIRNHFDQYSGTYQQYNEPVDRDFFPEGGRSQNMAATTQDGSCSSLPTAKVSAASFETGLSHQHQSNINAASSPAILDGRYGVLGVRNPHCQVTGLWLGY